MCKATEARIVWLALAQKYSARHLHLYRPESGAFNDLNTNDLREWARNRLIVDHIWRARSAKPHIRTLPQQTLTVPKLVPGGRWLLAGHLYGRIRCYDLNSENPEPVQLIRPSKDVKGSSQDVTGFDIDRGENTSSLEFKIAMSGTGEKGN